MSLVQVTELDRRQRNLQIRTAMHTQKITELEVYMSKSELGIHTALDSYSRVNSRLDVFKVALSHYDCIIYAYTDTLMDRGAHIRHTGIDRPVLDCSA